jgi:hypothetical protein
MKTPRLVLVIGIGAAIVLLGKIILGALIGGVVLTGALLAIKSPPPVATHDAGCLQFADDPPCEQEQQDREREKSQAHDEHSFRGLAISRWL